MPTPVPYTDVREIDWSSWQFTDHAVLCFIRVDSRLLLIRKKRGLGAGKINAPGGRLEPGETPLQAAIRETREEVGLVPEDPLQQGELSFVFRDGYSLYCSVFFATSYRGRLVETDEAQPFWCAESAIPYPEMWADDALWLPQALQGRYVRGVFIFDGDRMVSRRISADGRVFDQSH
jgi:8-oxo-dGTP diphosphatase